MLKKLRIWRAAGGGRFCVHAALVAGTVLLAWPAAASRQSRGTEVETPPPGYQLDWADEFNRDGPPDAANWTFENGFVRNQELQWYQPDNARVERGLLLIEGRRERRPNPLYQAGSTCSPDRGRAVWADTRTPLASLGADWSSQFHVWRMDWDADRIQLFVDDRKLNDVDLSRAVNQDGTGINPFHQPHYLIANLAIGGQSGGDPAATTFPARYEVDYVRVYKKMPAMVTAR